MIRSGLVSIALLLGFSCCNQPFDPRGTLDQRLVVFSILSTDRSQQFVRVERSYMPEDYNPLSATSDPAIVGATVTLRTSGGTFRLRDTTYSRADTSRYDVPFTGYVLNSLKADYGKYYTLSVSWAAYSPVTASVQVPYKPSISLEPASYLTLDNPAASDGESRILFPLSMGYNAKGIISRLFVYYDVLKEGEWLEERQEIPVSYRYSGIADLDYVNFGSVTPRTSTGLAIGVYTNELYKKMLAHLAYGTYEGTKIIFNRVVFVVIQLDPNLYDYYVTVHANNDPHSIRLDEPSYSNVARGLGLVGAYTVDSLVHILPEGFTYDKY